jgi:hypothetical protein
MHSRTKFMQALAVAPAGAPDVQSLSGDIDKLGFLDDRAGAYDHARYPVPRPPRTGLYAPPLLAGYDCTVLLDPLVEKQW